MNIIYPISFLTNSFISILSSFIDEITVLFPFSDYYEKERELIKLNIFKDFNEIDSVSSKDISNIISWAGQFENLSDSILSESLQSNGSTETIDEIINSIKKSSFQDISHISQDNKSLLLRFFYEYDRKQEEINADYNIFQDKFTGLSKILNGQEEQGEVSASNHLKINPIDFNILKPGLRLKIWTQLLNEMQGYNALNLIGVSREIKDIVGDVYFNLTGELPETVLELDCDNIKATKDDKKNITILIDKLFSLNNQDIPNKSVIFKQILAQLETQWKFSYKPKDNSVIKLYFMKLNKTTLKDILLYNAGLKGKKDVILRENDTVAIFAG